jgi:RHS repeat-associated protein
MCLQHPIEPDHLGSPRKVIDPSRGTALWDWPILGNAFGTAAANDDPDGDGNATTLNLRFPGQQYDAATGLHYNYFRDYDPATGRYVESDPIGLSGGFGTYAYVSAQPLFLVDPLGLCSEGCCSKVSWPQIEGGQLGGTVRCCQGKEFMCINPSICDGLSPDACQIKQRCITRHEQFHLDKHFACIPNSDQNEPFDKNRSECEAYRDEQPCLSVTRCQSTQCKKEIMASQKFNKKQSGKYCGRAGL